MRKCNAKEGNLIMVTTPTPGTIPYDASEFLGSSEAQAELLNDALVSGNPAYVAHALGVIAKAIGMSELARRTGIKRQSLYAALDEEGNPTLETFFSVLQALGIVLQAECAATAAGAAAGKRESSRKREVRPSAFDVSASLT
jgi:probable addiction module antidote protein